MADTAMPMAIRRTRDGPIADRMRAAHVHTCDMIHGNVHESRSTCCTQNAAAHRASLLNFVVELS